MGGVVSRKNPRNETTSSRSAQRAFRRAVYCASHAVRPAPPSPTSPRGRRRPYRVHTHRRRTSCPLPTILRRRRQHVTTDTRSVVRVTEHFGYAIDKRYLPVLLPFLLRPARDGVTLTDEGSFFATFGLFKIATQLSNINGAHVTTDYRWWTAVGVRMSRVDDGLTFGTNHNRGVCIHFAEKVPSPLRRSGHSALTVTVADVGGLTKALSGTREEPTAPSA